MSLDIDAIVLAGGLGTRLKGVLPDGYPKVMATVGDRPFIELMLERLYGQGVRKVVFALGYGARHVVDHLAARPAGNDLELHYVIERAPLGTGGGLRLAYSKISSDPLVALNGDTYCNVDLPQLVAFHRERRAAITLALAHVLHAGRYGRVECAADGEVTRFAEKDAAAGPGLINCGVYVISRALMDGLPQGKVVSWERDVLAQRVGKGIYALEAADRFLDIGTPESFSAASAFLSNTEAEQ